MRLVVDALEETKHLATRATVHAQQEGNANRLLVVGILGRFLLPLLLELIVVDGVVFADREQAGVVHVEHIVVVVGRRGCLDERTLQANTRRRTTPSGDGTVSILLAVDRQANVHAELGGGGGGDLIRRRVAKRGEMRGHVERFVTCHQGVDLMRGEDDLRWTAVSERTRALQAWLVELVGGTREATNELLTRVRCRAIERRHGQRIVTQVALISSSSSKPG